MKTIDICLTPELLHLYRIEDKIIVVVDILRATSCMTTAIAYGVASIIPVATIEECKAWQQKGLLVAAERGGEKIDGFDLGNSPFSYMDAGLKGKSIAITTTNGTLAISKARKAKQLIVGSFLNLSAVIRFLNEQAEDILIVCAGWKGKFNLEDTVFAGAVADHLTARFTAACDSTLAAISLYHAAKNNLAGFLSNSSHVQRLARLNIEKDVEFCLIPDQFDVIPVLKGEKLLKLEAIRHSS